VSVGIAGGYIKRVQVERFDGFFGSLLSGKAGPVVVANLSRFECVAKISFSLAQPFKGAVRQA